MSHYLTKQGLLDLQEELKKLLEVDLPKTLAALNSARQDGDLRENAAYQTSLKIKDELTTRQQEIEEILKDYQIIEEDTSSTKNKIVQLGSTVKIEYQEDKQTFEMKIVGSSESDILSGKISNESPIAESILGKKLGDTTTFKTPTGKLSVKIIEIS
jgi:transcription elongation factor GreA